MVARLPRHQSSECGKTRLGRAAHLHDSLHIRELAANLFRITQARDKLQRDGVTDKNDANATHFTVGRKVRQTIAELRGTMPEDLPTPAESIHQLERKEQKAIEAERQPSLFGGDDTQDTSDG